MIRTRSLSALSALLLACVLPAQDAVPLQPPADGGPWIETFGVGDGLFEVVVGGAPIEGLPFGLRLRGGPAGALALVAIGGFGPGAPSGLGFPLYPSAPGLRLVVLDGEGSADVLSVPQLDSGFVGQQFVVQAITLDAGAPGGVRSTRGLYLRVGDAADAVPQLDPIVGVTDGVTSRVQLQLSGRGVFPGDQIEIRGGSNGPERALVRDDRKWSASVLLNKDALNGLELVERYGDDENLSLESEPLPFTVLQESSTAALFGIPKTAVPFAVDAAYGSLGGDPLIDAVVLGLFDLFVYEGTEGGAFRLVDSIPLDDQGEEVAVGDMNGDGLDDLVVSTRGSLSIYCNSESGFVLSATRPPIFSLTLELAQVSEGEDLDVVVGGHGISVFLGDGLGGFEGTTLFSGGFSSVTDLAIGDLNGDGRVDLVGAGQSVSVVFGQEDGSLSPGITLSFFSASSVAIGQIDGDSNPDVAIFNQGGLLQVLAGDGAGAFLSLQSLQIDEGSFGDLQLAPLDGDAFEDGVLLARGSSGGARAIVLQGGPGGLSPVIDYPVGVGVEVTIRDMDGDSLPDAAVSGGSDLSFLPGDGAGAFVPNDSLAVGSEVYSAVIAHLDEDAFLDVAAGGLNSSSEPRLLSLRGNGVGGLGSLDDSLLGTLARSLVAEQVDSSSPTDLLASDVLLRGQAGGSFSSESLPIAGGPVFSTLADVDGQNDLDILLTQGFTELFYLQSVSGGSGYAVAQQFSLSPFMGTPATGDVNGDGRVDVLVTNSNVDQITLLLGNESNLFGAPRSFAVGDGPSAVAVEDLNGDGFDDVVVANQRSGDVSVRLGSRTGLRAEDRYPVGTGPVALVIADMDGDGNPDVVVVNQDNDSISLLTGVGDGLLGTQERFAVGDFPSGLDVGDLDNDGLLDLVVSNRRSRDLTVLINRR